MDGQPSPHLIAIQEKAAKGGEDGEGQHHVEYGGATGDDVHAVQRDEQARDSPDEVRARESACDSRGHQDRQSPEDGNRESPPEWGHSEEPLARGDDPLAEGRMHNKSGVILEDINGAPVAVGGKDQFVGAVIELLLMAVSEECQRVFGVIHLIEGKGIGSSEVGEAQNAADKRDHQRPEPSTPAP